MDYLSANKENGQWLVFIKNKQVYLDDLSYLNLLLQKSKEAINSFQKRDMMFIMYDFQEIKETNSLFFEKYRILINSEISTLQRLSSEKISKIKK